MTIKASPYLSLCNGHRESHPQHAKRKQQTSSHCVHPSLKASLDTDTLCAYLSDVLRGYEREALYAAQVLTAGDDGGARGQLRKALLGAGRPDRRETRLRRGRQNDALRRGRVLRHWPTDHLLL